MGIDLAGLGILPLGYGISYPVAGCSRKRLAGEFLAGPGERYAGGLVCLRSLWSGSFRPTHLVWHWQEDARIFGQRLL